jgi:hypothetical protein
MHLRLLNDQGYPQCLCGYTDEFATTISEKVASVARHVEEKLMEETLDEQFVPWPKHPDLIAVTPSGRVMNLVSQTLMLPWGNEEDNDRMWVNVRFTQPGSIKDIEVAVWKLIKDTFGGDYAG